MLTLSQAVSRVASRLNKNANDTTIFNRIKNHINDTCQEKWHGFAWSFRYREYPIVLSAQVTSGTLTATNGNTAVTASGTPFITTLHKGAWLYFPQDTLQAWYKVVTVNSTSSITIEPAYQGTTGGSKSYYLCKTDYLLPTEVSDVGDIKITYSGRPLTTEHQSRTDYYFQPPLSIGTPNHVTVLNQDQVLTTYTTGTVSGSINTNVLTGTNTTWLANVSYGDEILVNGDTNTYRVRNIDSDTQITLYNNLKVAAVGASYTISRQFGKVLRFSPAPDNPYVLFIKGLRAYAPLINNADTNELLVRYPSAVIEGAIWREAGASPDPREDSLFARSELLWARAQGEDEQILPQVNYHPIWNPRQGY